MSREFIFLGNNWTRTIQAGLACAAPKPIARGSCGATESKRGLEQSRTQVYETQPLLPTICPSVSPQPPRRPQRGLARFCWRRVQGKQDEWRTRVTLGDFFILFYLKIFFDVAPVGVRSQTQWTHSRSVCPSACLPADNDLKQEVAARTWFFWILTMRPSFSITSESIYYLMSHLDTIYFKWHTLSGIELANDKILL